LGVEVVGDGRSDSGVLGRELMVFALKLTGDG